MYKIVAFFAILGFSCVAAETPVYACDNGLPLPRSTQVNDCTELPCDLPQGSTVSATIIFKSNVDTSALRPEVIAYALGVEVNYPLDESNGCNALVDMACPVEEGENVTYLLEMPVLAIFPQIPLSMQFTMYDENEAGMTCFMIDAQVTAPLDK